jgi:chemotaxis family two-component system response regulator Rcp1
MYRRSIRLLLIEDCASDVWLVREALRLAQVRVQMTIARDGVEATDYLRSVQMKTVACPDLIVLDLNLPRKNGHEVLAEIKSSPWLQGIPIVVFSGSNADGDRRRAYELHASCFITKPDNLPAYVETVRDMEKFWLSSLRLRQPA